MKFRCERDTLAEAVATAQRAVASRTGAHARAVGAAGSRSPATCSSWSAPTSSSRSGSRIPADGDGDGTAVVPARLFTEILQKLDAGAVTVELDDDEATIESGRFTTTLRTLAAAEFPRLPEPSEDGGVKVDAARVRPKRCAR